MRVLVLANTFPPDYTGGAEVVNYHACRGLIRRGIDCSLLVVNNRMASSVNNWYELDRIPVHRVHLQTRWRSAWNDVFDWRVYRIIRAELRRLKPDLVHIHNVSGATLAPYIACRTAGVPVVNTLHDLWLLCPNNMLYKSDGSFCDPLHSPYGCHKCFRRYDFWGNVPYRRAVFAALTANVRLFISPGQAVIDRHIEAGYARQRFRLLRLGFEESMPQEPQHPDVRAISAAVSRDPIISFAGGGVEIKGPSVLIRALPALLKNVEHLKIIIVGRGEPKYLNQFRQYAPSVQVLGSVAFNDMRSLFAASDLTLVPSTCHENSPVVIYESFSVGTPVVGSAFGGTQELIREGETGYRFPVGDAAALAEKVIHHFDRPAHERRAMRRHCVAQVRQHLTLNNHLDGLEQIYQEVLNG